MGAKMVETPIEMLFRGTGTSSPKNVALDGSPDSPWKSHLRWAFFPGTPYTIDLS